tara:strand:- start:5281 stop:6549 length:1269 start_codon:yes stop_codon:yes gene_type:complete
VKSKFQKVKGMFDTFPDADDKLRCSAKWQQVENILHETSKQFGYQEIRTPSVEKAELFNKNIGVETDVSREVFTWEDINGDHLILKPEMTAPVVRAYIENGLLRHQPLSKLYYIDSFFRRENTQKGRQRQFHQFGVEVVGGPSKSHQDAEIILFAWTCMEKLKIKNKKLVINNIGDDIEIRIRWERELKKYFQKHLKKLSTLSQKRVEKNPMRILDSKEKEDQEIIKKAPTIDQIPQFEPHKFKKLRENLDDLGIEYDHDPYLVRGLDYYNGNVFEIRTSSGKAQNALCGGGRYDHLIEKMGNPSKQINAVGFAAGIERMISESELEDPKKSVDVYLVCGSSKYYGDALCLIQKLINSNHSLYFDTNRDEIKRNNGKKHNAKFAILVGGKSKYFALDLSKPSDAKPINSENIDEFLEILKLQ